MGGIDKSIIRAPPVFKHVFLSRNKVNPYVRAYVEARYKEGPGLSMKVTLRQERKNIGYFFISQQELDIWARLLEKEIKAQKLNTVKEHKEKGAI